MRISKNAHPKTREELDKWVVGIGLRPYGVVEYRGRDIFLAETDLENDQPKVFPLGYWQTCWFCTTPDSLEVMDVGRWIDFDPFHDADQSWSPAAKREARIQTTIKDAQCWIDKNIEKGRMDA